MIHLWDRVADFLDLLEEFGHQVAKGGGPGLAGRSLDTFKPHVGGHTRDPVVPPAKGGERVTAAKHECFAVLATEMRGENDTTLAAWRMEQGNTGEITPERRICADGIKDGGGEVEMGRA